MTMCRNLPEAVFGIFASRSVFAVVIAGPARENPTLLFEVFGQRVGVVADHLPLAILLTEYGGGTD